MIVAGFDRPNIRYAISPRDNTTRQIADLIAEQPGPGIVYAQTRKAVEQLAEKLAATGRPARPYHAGLEPACPRAQPGRFRRVRGHGDGRHGRVRHGHRQAGRALRRACRHCRNRSRPIIRKPAAPGATAIRRSRICSGGGGFRQGAPADRRSRAAPPGGRAHPADRAGRAGRDGGVPAAHPAQAFRRGVARDLRQLRQLPEPAERGRMRPRSRVKFLSAVFRTGQSFGVGYIESILTGQSSERSLMNGHEALQVFGIAIEPRGSRADQAGRARAAAARCAARQ